MEKHLDTEADKKIKICICEHKNFYVNAGAGSGKTESLIKALIFIRQKFGRELHINGQQIACITYTNAAVNVIKGRTNSDILFYISTIHSFLWDLIKWYQNDIRTIVYQELIPAKIAKKREDDNGGSSNKAVKARNQIERLTQDLAKVPSVEHFAYLDSGKRDYSKGILGHEDIIDIASIMINKSPILQKIIGQKFPYILIDEAQDTFINVMESLNSVAENEGLPIIGYFGDPMQQIYTDNRAGEFKGPEGSIEITKFENYRCSKEVIKLLNSIRPDLQQQPDQDNLVGSVEIRLIKAEEGAGYRHTYSDLQISNAVKQFDIAVEYFGWTGRNEVKQLFLTWQMIANRIGFSKLNELFTGEYASETAQDAFRKGNHFILQPFIDVLIPLMVAKLNHDNVTMTQILRKYSPILDPNGVNEKSLVMNIKKEIDIAINSLAEVWQNATIREIYEIARKYNLINIPSHLADQLDRSPRSERYDESLHVLDKEDWLIDNFLEFQTTELMPYRNFILEATPYGTQHGTKGEEFEKVLVIFDDTEANWNIFNFSRLLTPNSSSGTATEGQRKRSLNLAYVCFSRAIMDLRIILFTTNPESAKEELIRNGLFTSAQVSIQ